jgi:hypothetical protein
VAALVEACRLPLAGMNSQSKSWRNDQQYLSNPAGNASVVVGVFVFFAFRDAGEVIDGAGMPHSLISRAV